MPFFEKHVFICTNRRDPSNPKGSCAAKGSEAVREQFKKQIFERGLKGQMRANAAGCLDQCEHGCTVVVYPEQVWYGNVTPDDVSEIIEEHLVKGKPVERLLIPDQPHLKVDSRQSKVDSPEAPDPEVPDTTSGSQAGSSRG